MGLVAYIMEKLSPPKAPVAVDKSIYDFKLKSLTGEEIDFSRYRGKALLIVNTASKCSFTPQYEALQQLHEKYGDTVTVLGFPANNFLWQEPGGHDAIAEFCQVNYGVTFQMFEKVSVRGHDKHPLFQWLEAKTGRTPTWNFAKFLVDKYGKDVRYYHPRVSPLSNSILKRLLA